MTERVHGSNRPGIGTGSEPETVDELRAAWGQLRRPELLFFWGHTTNRDTVGAECLSQWYPSPFESDGQTFATSEHYMMWAKAQLFGDADAAEAILASSQPAKAKELGRGVRGFDKARWKAHRFGIVTTANRHKFAQHEALRQYLLSTNPRILVEASPYDRIWGIGLKATDPKASEPYFWQGQNLLGFALMSVRRELLRQQR